MGMKNVTLLQWNRANQVDLTQANHSLMDNGAEQEPQVLKYQEVLSHPKGMRLCQGSSGQEAAGALAPKAHHPHALQTRCVGAPQAQIPDSSWFPFNLSPTTSSTGPSSLIWKNREDDAKGLAQCGQKGLLPTHPEAATGRCPAKSLS